MNKIISFAKIMFAGLAIYLSFCIVRNIPALFIYTFQDFGLANVGMLVLSLSLSIAMLVAVVWFLVLKSEKWARKLIAKDIDANQPMDIQLTLTMAFRLVSVGAGIYCLFFFSDDSFAKHNTFNVGHETSAWRADHPDLFRSLFCRKHSLVAVFGTCDLPALRRPALCTLASQKNNTALQRNR